MHCGRHHLSSNAAPIYRQVRAKRRKTVAPSRFSFFSPISPLCFYCFNKLVKKKNPLVTCGADKVEGLGSNSSDRSSDSSRRRIRSRSRCRSRSSGSSRSCRIIRSRTRCSRRRQICFFLPSKAPFHRLQLYQHPYPSQEKSSSLFT